MIPNHAHFIAALKHKKKVRVKFNSKADGGVLERICAPLAYGPAGEFNDGLNRYWLWDYESSAGACALGLMPQQIIDLQILTDEFDPAEFTSSPSPLATPHKEDLPPAPIASDGGPINPGL